MADWYLKEFVEGWRGGCVACLWTLACGGDDGRGLISAGFQDESFSGQLAVITSAFTAHVYGETSRARANKFVCELA